VTPFKSQAQRRKFAELLLKGKISHETFGEWNRETGSAKLPERVKPKPNTKFTVNSRAKRTAKDQGKAQCEVIPQHLVAAPNFSSSGRAGRILSQGREDLWSVRGWLDLRVPPRRALGAQPQRRQGMRRRDGLPESHLSVVWANEIDPATGLIRVCDTGRTSGAVEARAADRWRGLTVGEFEQRQLRAIREELDRAHAERVRPAVRPNASASAVRLSSKART
jgi:hypothetical protein